MEQIIFGIFALLTLGAGLGVVLSRNPVNSAMFLVAAIISMAGLFVQLHAFFLAAVQILVYAGAVMVLFIFVIMLLDLKAEEKKGARLVSALAGTACAGAVAMLVLRAITSGTWKEGVSGAPIDGATKPLGELLFSSYLLPFELLSVLLLVAMVGAILLSKRELS